MFRVSSSNPAIVPTAVTYSPPSFFLSGMKYVIDTDFSSSGCERMKAYRFLGSALVGHDEIGYKRIESPRNAFDGSVERLEIDRYICSVSVVGHANSSLLYKICK